MAMEEHEMPRTARHGYAQAPMLLALAALACGAAWAGEAGAPLELRANFETIAVKLACPKRDFESVAGQLEYREKGAADWKPAHRLARIAGYRLAGSIFRLKPNTAYEVRATLVKDGKPTDDVRVAAIRTEDDEFPAKSGRTIHVSVEQGHEAGDGSAAKPVRTIQRAVALSKPGDVVLVARGLYREQVFVGAENSGAPGAYIHYKAEGPGVILDGSHPVLAKDPRAQGWTNDDWKPSAAGPGVYEAVLPAGAAKSDWLFVNEKRLFTYETLDELKACPADGLKSPTLGFYGPTLGAYFFDAANGKLYAKPRQGEDPDSVSVNLPVLQNGFTVQDAHHVIVDGFEIRYYGATLDGSATYANGQTVSGLSRGVYIRDSHHCVVRNCLILGCFRPIRVLKSTRVVTEDNYVVDNLGYGLCWSVKQSPYAAYNGPKGAKYAHSQGIAYEGAHEDMVIRRNVVQGFVDGIEVSDGSGERYENYDIYGNVVTETRDDALELDCDDVNMKVWGNVFFENHTAISLSGCEVGPAFIFENIAFRYFNESYKLHGRASSGPIFVYRNTHSSQYTGDPEIGKGIEINFSPPFAREDYLVLSGNIFEGTQFSRDEEGAPAAAESFKSDYNCWNGPIRVTRRAKESSIFKELAAFTAAFHMDQHSLMADPRFKDGNKGDFQLADGSPCVDAGTPIPNILDTFAGKAPDLGAWESGVPNPLLQQALEKLALVRSGALLSRMRGR